MKTTPPTPRRYDLGGCTITLVSGGSLKLDGGAMFGIIPKPLWSRQTLADERNRIQLACNCLLVEWARETDRRVIVEAGHGPKYGQKEQDIFAIDPSAWLLPHLRTLGVDPATITDVVVSHLHFDHCGGLTWERDGQTVPTFVNARVHVQRREFEDARANFGMMTQTYREESYAPIDGIDAWNLLDGEEPIVEGIRPLLTPGHTRGHHSIIIAGRDRCAVYGGDVMPTRNHLGRPYGMAYDLFPLENRASKEKLLKTVADRDGLLVIDHEPDTPIVGVTPEGNYYTLTEPT
jgi:glyoxylase-like metal-dependent hydrolase (beta-lactamase superfamily II)